MADTQVPRLHDIFSKVIADAVSAGLHNRDRVLLLLTETDPNSAYGYDDECVSYPHSTDGRMIMPFGTNEKGQKQFLISFDPSGCDDKSHPDPSVPEGWDWEIFSQQKSKQETSESVTPILLILTSLTSVDPDNTSNYSRENPRDLHKDPLAGFEMAAIGMAGGHQQYAIMIDPRLFNVQIGSIHS